MQWCIPLATIMLLLVGCSVLLKEKKYTFKYVVKIIFIPFIIASILTSVLLFLDINFIELIFFFACIFVLASQIQALIVKIIQAKKIKLIYFSSFFSHTGIAVFLAGAVLYGTFSADEEVFLEKNKSFSKNEFQFTITKFDIDSNQKYTTIIPNIDMKYKNNNFTLTPKIIFTRINKINIENNIAEESFEVAMFPAVVSVGLTDIYIEPIKITRNSAAIYFLFSIKPFINLVWLGFGILFVGLMLSVILKKNKIT